MLPIHTPGGIGRFTRILGAILLSNFADELYLFLQRRQDLGLILSELAEEDRDEFEIGDSIHIIPSSFSFLFRQLLNQWEIPAKLGSENVDLILNPDIVATPIGGTKKVIVVYDVTPFTHPSFLGWKARVLYGIYARSSLRVCDAIICISEHTKKKLLGLYPYLKSKCHVVRPCLSPKFYHFSLRSYQPKEEVRVRTVFGSVTIKRPYILYVGDEGPRKNLPTLISAFMRLRERGFPHKLVLVGGRAERPRLSQGRVPQMATPTAGNLTLAPDSPSIIRLGRISDDELISLYRHADVVPLISLEEGFGYPSLESLAFRTPIIVPENSPMAEFSSHGVTKVSDPLSVDEVAEKMAEVISTACDCPPMLWSYAELEQFSPQRFFGDLMQVLSKVAS